MKRLLCILAMVSGVSSFAGNWVNIHSALPSPANTQLISSVTDRSVVRFSFNGFYLNEVNAPINKSVTVSLPGATPLLKKGAPDLPKLTASLIIPGNSSMKAHVISSQYIDYHNINIAPGKGDLTRDIDPSTVPYTYGEIYAQNIDFPGILASSGQPYIFRDYRGQSLVVYPFQYNPQTRTLRVFYDITVEFKKDGISGINTLSNEIVPEKTIPEYNAIYSRHFLNYQTAKYSPVEEEGSMLIISYGAFIPAMQPFINWKISRGIPVEIVDVATIGNAAAIKNYLQMYYAEHNLGFVLLVGDHQQVPAFMSASGASDNSYTYVAGNDHYNDFLIGRFSAENVEQVATQVSKVLYYEIYPDTNTNWFESSIGIGSDQGPGDDNEYDYQHIRGLQTLLDNYTYNTSYELFDGSQGGFDAPGDPSASLAAEDINAGASVIVYCGHGSQNSFVTTGFSSGNVNSLNNNGMLPFIFSVACVNGDFTGGGCFAEAWLRAKNGDHLTGAVATMMSTINQSWNPPMEGQDEMVAVLTESYSNNIKRTFAGIAVSGLSKMIDAYAGGGESMADTWVCFGDPSLVVRTAMPQVITASHVPTTFIGLNQFEISCPVDGALACITLNNEILGTALVNNGITTVTYSGPLTSIDTLKLVITNYNYIPYIAYIPVIAPSGPFIAYQSYQVIDPMGNNNGLADFGENISLNMTLKNLGVERAADVIAVLNTVDSYVTLTDNSESFGDMEVNNPVTQNLAYTLIISNSIPDHHHIPFTVTMTDSTGTTWNSSFSMTVNAPAFQVFTVTIDDAGGNGNGNLDPGETVNLIIPTKNTGHADAPGTMGTLISGSPFVTINTAVLNLNTMGTGIMTDAVFNITVSNDAPIGTNADFVYTVASGAYSSQKTFYKVIGIVNEPFETGDFTHFNWQLSGNLPWIITTEDPYEGTYCSKSGAIDHSQESVMQLTMNVLIEDSISFYRKVSSENTYDWLSFYIDNIKVGEWSGEKGWERIAYPVTAGNHTFKWSYEKDYMAIGGADAVWVDNVVFPPVDLATSTIDHTGPDSPVLSLFPNPAMNSVSVVYNLFKSGETRIFVLDITGKSIKEVPCQIQNSGSHTVNINVSDLESGMYMMMLQTNSGRYSTKLIINR